MNKIFYFIFAFLITLNVLNAQQTRFVVYDIQDEYFVNEPIELSYYIYDEAYKYRVSVISEDTLTLLTNDVYNPLSTFRGWLKYNFDDEYNNLTLKVEYFVDGVWKTDFISKKFKIKIGDVYFVEPTTNVNYFYNFLTEINLQNKYFKPDLILLQNDTEKFIKTLNDNTLEERNDDLLKTSVFLSTYSTTIKLKIVYKNYSWESSEINVSKDNIELIIDSLRMVINKYQYENGTLKERLIQFDSVIVTLDQLNTELLDSLEYYKPFKIKFLEASQTIIDMAGKIEDLKSEIDSLHKIINSFKHDTLLIVVDDVLATRFEEYVSLVKQVTLKVDDYYVTIEDILGKNHKIFIFDTIGKVKYINEGIHKPINVIDYPSGVYFIYVQGFGLYKFILM